MGFGKAEYQNPFNAKGTAEKNYKIRERTSDFFEGEIALAFTRPALTRECSSSNHHQACLADVERGTKNLRAATRAYFEPKQKLDSFKKCLQVLKHAL